MRLNKYIAHTRYCTRREASRLLARGEIKVNNKVVKEESYRVMEGDEVTHLNKPLQEQIVYMYLLINKPKHFTTDIGDKDSKYIMGLIKKEDPTGLIAVDHMGPKSVGLLLLTSDKALVEKLNQKNRKVRRVYLIELNKDIEKKDINKLLKDRKTIKIESASHVDGYQANYIGLEMTIGSENILKGVINRMGFEIQRIDRSYYAGLTKKDLKRGWIRPLQEMEERMMKHFI